jgi:hypothetical protein
MRVCGRLPTIASIRRVKRRFSREKRTPNEQELMLRTPSNPFFSFNAGFSTEYTDTLRAREFYSEMSMKCGRYELIVGKVREIDVC